MQLWKEHKYFDLNKKEHVYHADVFLEKNEKLEIVLYSSGKRKTLHVVPAQSKIHLEVKHTSSQEILKKLNIS